MQPEIEGSAAKPVMLISGVRKDGGRDSVADRLYSSASSSQLSGVNALTPGRTLYSRHERISDAAVHVTGTAAALAAVPVLIVVAATLRGDAPAIAGAAIYGVTLIAMLLCSALYHLIRRPGWQGILRRLDHSAIYLKIAGTYTAFVLLSGGTGAGLVVILWIAALAGVLMKTLAPYRFRRTGLALCLAMGWIGLVGGWPLFASMSGPVLALVVTGGLLYTVGTIFYLIDALPFHTTIWHVFVLAASMVFYAAVTAHVVGTAALAG